MKWQETKEAICFGLLLPTLSTHHCRDGFKIAQRIQHIRPGIRLQRHLAKQFSQDLTNLFEAYGFVTKHYQPDMPLSCSTLGIVCNNLRKTNGAENSCLPPFRFHKTIPHSPLSLPSTASVEPNRDDIPRSGRKTHPGSISQLTLARQVMFQAHVMFNPHTALSLTSPKSA